MPKTTHENPNFPSAPPPGSAVRVSDTAIFLILLLALCAMALIAGLVNGWTIPTTN